MVVESILDFAVFVVVLHYCLSVYTHIRNKLKHIITSVHVHMVNTLSLLYMYTNI